LATAVEAPAEAVAEIEDGADVTDPDDIDALLDAAAKAPVEGPKDIEDGTDVTDPDDIDALLDAVAVPPTEISSEIEDGADVTDPDDIDALLESIPQESESKDSNEESDVEVSDPDDIDALMDSIAADQGLEDEDLKDVEITDPDDIDALLESVPNTNNLVDSDEKAELSDDEGDIELTDADDIDALLDSVSAVQNENTDKETAKQDTLSQPNETANVSEDITTTDENATSSEENPNEELINNFSEEYVAPFLSVDFSDITGESKEPGESTVDEDKLESIQEDITDELDIDALISEVNEEQIKTDSGDNEIGDDLFNETADEQSVDDLPELNDDFDESTLTELLNEEKEEHSPIELSPDFTDSDVLADLLSEDEMSDDKSSEVDVDKTTEIEDIKELDNLDFDELLANIEEESTSVTESDITEDIDLADDLDNEFDIGDDIAQDVGEATVEATTNDDDFISVDSLLSESLDSEEPEEPYKKDSIDVGLGDFPEFTNDNNQIDVDDDDNGIAAKLDLAKVYVEIGDTENAEVILSDVVNQGDAQQQFEAQQLLDALNE